MKILSSDQSYYKGLTGLIISPVILFFFFNSMLGKGQSAYTYIIIYSLIGLLWIIQGYKMINTRKILYNEGLFIIEAYFTNKKIKISSDDVLSIKTVFNITKYISLPGRKIDYLYKIRYSHNGKIYKSYFFKNPSINDLGHFLPHLNVTGQ